jgi:hypothetical protein
LKPANSIPSTTIIANTTTSTGNAPSTTGSVGYAPDAAWLAVRRHMQMTSFDDSIVGSFVFEYFVY